MTDEVPEPWAFFTCMENSCGTRGKKCQSFVQISLENGIVFVGQVCSYKTLSCIRKYSKRAKNRSKYPKLEETKD